MIDDIDDMLWNWARYKLTKEGKSMSFPWVRLITEAARSEASPGSTIPINQLEADAVDRYVQALEPLQSDAVKENYLFTNEKSDKAKRCKCSVRTFDRRLHRAHVRIAELHNDQVLYGILPYPFNRPSV